MIITKDKIKAFKHHLITEEKSPLTVEKYVRDINIFSAYSGTNRVDKNVVVNYKTYLMERYAISSVNSMVSSLNCFFDFCNKNELKLKTIRCQRKMFIPEQKNLTIKEYERLIDVAEGRMSLILQTICTTGIRVSELRFITVESAISGLAEISCKGKQRRIFLPKSLCEILQDYAEQKNIFSGSIFLSNRGNPLDRSNIWSEMKSLCEKARVLPEKVFPHNLRHLFAKTYYSSMKDIVRLADVLGHSSLNTTRIYTAETGEIHRRQIEQLGLVKTHN